MAKVNLQQIPKDRSILETLVPRSGWKFVELDISALEPTIQASFSKDPTLMELYASGKEHDIYLYFAQFVHPDPLFRSALREEYKSDANVLEGLKKKYKQERNLIKQAVLAMGYGASPRRIQLAYKSAGFDVPFETCQQIHVNYWELLGKLKTFERNLKYEWRARNGYILDGFGLPRCVPEDMTKDILNRFVQSTGHGVLLKFLVYVNNLRKSRGVHMLPVIPDLHDETIFQAPEEQVSLAVSVLADSLVEVNRKLTAGTSHLPFKGGVEVCGDFVKFKIGG
jgi:hypothetical protein